MKKLTAALVSAGLLLSLDSYAAFASCANDGYSSALCAPRNCGGFYIGGSAFRVLGTGTGDDMSVKSGQKFIPIEQNSTSGTYRSHYSPFKPDYDWAWEAKVGYDFPCSANNIELSYFHYDKTTSYFDRLLAGTDDRSFDSYWATNFGFPALPIPSSVGDVGAVILNSFGRLSYRMEKADLTLGRTYNDVCGHFNFHPFIGVRYAKLKQNLNIKGNSIVSFIASPATVLSSLADISLFNVYSKFKGWGPEIGFDTRYGLGGGFGIVSRFDAAFLTGQVDSHLIVQYSFTPITPEGVPVLVNAANNVFDRPSVDRIVAAISGKIGVDYNYCFCNRSSLTIEVGYHSSKYFDTFDKIRGDIQLPSPSPTGQHVTGLSCNDFDKCEALI